MTLPGTAFLALWNERTETREDYEAWHTREHVPQRLGVPGILAGWRYAGGEGPLPAYFTLYPLADPSVVDSAEYRAVVSGPTAWSRSMRGDLSRFCRRGCITTLSLGGGIGGCLGAVLLERRDATEPALQAFAPVRDLPAISALHLGHMIEIPMLPFEQGPQADLPSASEVLLVEGYDWARLPQALDALDGPIRAAGFERVQDWTRYRLAFALGQPDQEAVLPVDAEHLRRNAMVPV